MQSLQVGEELATYILLFWKLGASEKFFRPALSNMFLPMYYPSKSASPTTEENSQAKPTFKSMIQLRTEVSCKIENFDMKSTS